MPKTHPFMPTFTNLPTTLSVFPLPGAVVLPGGNLPLNIFEPRYLNMVQDAMKTHQLIGMIQPSDEGSPPQLHKVGCVGRITQYVETDGGRIEVVLTGLCRFGILKELDAMRGYRVVVPDWSQYEGDFDTADTADKNTVLSFENSLHAYFTQNQIEADWHVLKKLDTRDLLVNLISYLPLSVEDKQILIEADNFADRLIAFSAILNSDTDLTSTPQ